MKLKLENYRDINLLQASGPITLDNFAVLKAGIKKLFRDGKNKIILELPNSEAIPPEVLRELAVLNLMASEMAGQVVLSDIAPLTRAKIEAFSKPPAVRCFVSRATAIEFFHPPGDDLPTPEAAAVESVAPAAPGATKDEIRARELGDMGALRRKIVELETENRELSRRMTEFIVVRRDPPDLEAWKTKVETLERELSEAMAAAEKAAPKK